MTIPARLEGLLQAGTPAVDLARLFAAAGKELYLVGGSVRDALLDRSIEDLDFATDALPDEIHDIIASWADTIYAVGQAFGTVGGMRKGVRFEITTFRSEVYRDDSRKPRVSFSNDVTEDLSRRDFTVNAMALLIPANGSAPQMVDPHDGLTDLAGRVLRTPLGFSPDPEMERAVRDMRDRLAIVSAERVRDELNKLMVGDAVGDALWGLIDSRLAEEFIPEVPALAVEQDPIHHHKDVLAHTIAVVEKTSPRLRLRLGALFHDIGKPATRQFGAGGVSFHHHEVVGARMTRKRMKQLRYPKQDIEEVGRLVLLHMRPHTYKMGWTDSAVRRYVRDAGPLLDDLNELVRCDVTTRNEKRARAIERRIDELEERIEALREQEELDALRPPIDGHEVMAYLGLEPGPQVGEVMDLLYEHRIEHGPYDAAEAYALLDGWKRSGAT